jgi:AmmeMemoRadiSam system protein A
MAMADAEGRLLPLALEASECLVLLRVARDAIRYGLRFGEPPFIEDNFDARLLTEGACFVSLHRAEELRGCVGSLEARLPLVRQVAESAYDAAFCDLRLSPVRADELSELSIEISVLSPLRAVHAETERALLDLLRPGVDGVVVREGERRATFLPKVWETIPLPFDFLEHLKRKAGLPPRYWSPTLRFDLYTADSFGIRVAELADSGR